MRKFYTIARNIVVSAILLIVGIYLLLYVAVSLPSVQHQIKSIAQEELSKLLDAQVYVDQLSISPFNQIELEKVTLNDKSGNKVLTAEKIGGGISIWRLLYKGELVFTYAELIGLDIKITQAEPSSPVNIQFLIDALKPKDKNKPPTKFDFSIKSVVLRKSSLSFDRLWQPIKAEEGVFDINHIHISDLKGDISLPKMANNDFNIDVRRISFSEASGFELNSLSGLFKISDKVVSTGNLFVKLDNTIIHPEDISIRVNGLDKIVEAIKSDGLSVTLNNNKICPADFKCFVPELKEFDESITLNLEAEGNINSVELKKFSLLTDDSDILVRLAGRGLNLTDKDNRQIELTDLYLKSNTTGISNIINRLPKLNPNVRKIISNLKYVELDGRIKGNPSQASMDITFASAIGGLDIDIDYSKIGDNTHKIKGNLLSDGVDLGKLINKSDFGMMEVEADADIVVNGKKIDGDINLVSPLFTFKGYQYCDIIADLKKDGENIEGLLSIDDENISVVAEGVLSLTNRESHTDLHVDLQRFNPNALGLWNKYPDYNFAGELTANFVGNTPDNANGTIALSSLSFLNNNGDGLRLDELTIDAQNNEFSKRIDLRSSMIDGFIEGEYNFATLPNSFVTMASEILPSIISQPAKQSVSTRIDNETGSEFQQFNYGFVIKEDNQLSDFFRLPIRMVGDININGVFDECKGVADLIIDIPYLQQGKDKLVRNSYLAINVNRSLKQCDLSASTVLPGKNGDITVMLDCDASDNLIDSEVSWIFDRKRSFKGKVALSTLLYKDSTNNLGVDVNIRPSTFEINDTVWHIAPAKIKYFDNSIEANDIRVSNENQFVTINGKASKDPSDKLIISLNEMDLDYIFETLRINHVTFGGRASGELEASELFSGRPIAFTDGLRVKKFTYNDGLLGDAVIKSRWHNDEKKVTIDADIRDGKRGHSTINGGIWVGKDSLSFECNANYLNVLFLKPFLGAFTTDIYGRATGYAKLYGTFKDIDLIGKIHADTLRMRVDYTNTYYSGSDSIKFSPGRIEIPNFTLYDDYGNKAKLNGWVSHKYFREPSFSFDVTDVQNLLVYDTNESLNPDWYGHVYGNGSCNISGYPGVVDIKITMTTAPNSKFTFVLNDREYAEDYQFLTFTDKAKAAKQKENESTDNSDVPDIVKRFRKKVEIANYSPPSKFRLLLNVSATSQAEMIIIMDPIGGDKIKAFGTGNIRLEYNSDNKLTMTGTYELEKGSYNFTLQDIIRKDFIIRPNSSISFEGDPLEAILDIDAVYKVNTNLSDLDKSFSYDKDLNSTNVPVEAVLNVRGVMTNPEVNFDIDLPTVSTDVMRKVKSIISTDDMMNQQIIYLLALNRFYTPEYMGGQGNNNELASVASSTISSQLSNMLGQLSDNWSFSPYFRTDKGDFSDMEVDLALSSTLLNNRLLINGNFGYRDRTTSSTTFVGDFDIEYLLNKRGSLRLKAYNHYNDQNYYLKSALTTQGIGIIYKHDFNRMFSSLRRKKKSTDVKSSTDTLPTDTIMENITNGK